jgi:arginine/ornithine N-succinyltransferase beta subunit
MITRLSLRNRTSSELGIKSSGGITDLFDNQLKLAFRITDAEYDWIAERASDEELELLTSELKTFTLKRKLLVTLQKHLTEFHQQ